jgi:hypothetical protein
VRSLDTAENKKDGRRLHAPPAWGSGTYVQH